MTMLAQMIDTLHHMPLLETSFIVIGTSVMLVCAWAMAWPRQAVWMVGVTIPFIVSSVVYLLPGMVGGERADPRWAPVVVVIWTAAGIAASLLVLMMQRRLKK